ncbi:hypothetical protein SORBI_3007G186700 [Sorghum bicolor]|uniref:Uncharacterized protein n=1 Tax=Sorghum bicolor TaxID=4558 RepID=A0A1Z5RAQ9_SORBI|nr:hypothetical protein SORBI_3007G186700 [Sorghum bicolor]
MEATALSVGKSVLNGALGYAKSALAEEVALQLGIQRDHAFIRDELEMMLAFLMAAHEERDEHMVVKTWVKQVRDVAYDVEDSLEDFSVRLGNPSWCWRVFRRLLDRHRVAKQMKELRAKVEDVSQRNVRYRLIKGSDDTKPAIGTGQSIMMTGETMSGMEEARKEKDKAKVDLISLMNKMDENLQVIAIWGRPSYVLQEASIIKIVYDNLKRRKQFDCHAFVKIIHPFSSTRFLQNIIRQFFVDSLEEAEKSTLGAQDLRRMGMVTESDLVDAFNKYLNEKRYLIVLTDLSNIEEWDQIKALFPSNNKGSRLIVCAEQVEVASLCVEPKTTTLPEHKKLCSNQQVLYAFYEKGSQGGTDSVGEGSSSNTTDTINNNNKSSLEVKGLSRMETTLAALKESQLIGREKDKSEIIKRISDRQSQEFEVISICGMGGLGKTTLVKHVYQSQELSRMFEKHACVTIKRPFNLSELLNSLATQLGGNERDGDKLASLLDERSYLIILDDMSSTTEWDAIVKYFPTTITTSKIIVTTREENICKHCSKKENIHKLQLLGDEDAQKLFMEKVFGTVSHLDEEYPELADETKQILKKCNGLPLAIVTMGGFLARQPKTLMEWRKFNEHISAELEMNTELQRIPNVLVKSYEGLPYHLKSCFLYMSIFPEDYSISRRRLVQRWIAEGYSSEVRGKSMEETADRYFMELIDRSVILPVRKHVPSLKGIDSCQLHDLMREISISRAMDENLVFRLEEGSSSSKTQAKIRHVAISSNWEGDKCEFESAVDLSHIRSLTVFGRWRSFFISEKMKFLRVLDLEDSWGNLRQLQTLNMKGTRICNLPKSITHLTKLQYLFARGSTPACFSLDGRLPNDLAKLCGACCVPKLLKDAEWMDGDPNWHDVCTFWCHVVFPSLAWMKLDPYGIVVPRSVRKLKALHTLGLVNIADSSKSALRDIRKLTQLRKLAVTGINKKNYQELCSTVTGLSRLESLSMEFIEESMSLQSCLDDATSLLPKNLQSLKLYGILVRLQDWIGGLQSLVKLEIGRLACLTSVDATMQVLGKLPSLAILSLMWHPFIMTGNIRVTFHREAFPSLMVLHLKRIDGLQSVEFEEAGPTTPKLELLVLEYAAYRLRSISGLSSLPRLKEVVIEGSVPEDEEVMGSVRDQLSRNQNNPVLKIDLFVY